MSYFDAALAVISGTDDERRIALVNMALGAGVMIALYSASEGTTQIGPVVLPNLQF